MFVDRRINPATQAVEMWWCDWAPNPGGTGSHKVFLSKIAEEAYATYVKMDDAVQQPAICWSYGRTIGNIAVFSEQLLGSFPAASGDDAVLPCDFVSAGKFRHGAPRWWCRTHQTHWGTIADEAAYSQSGEMRCGNHAQPMSYAVAPLTLDLGHHAEVGIWCSMPAALSSEGEIKARRPRIHVHVRPEAGGKKTIDGDYPVVSVRYASSANLFGAQDITRVNITPPAAFEFVLGLENGRPMECINCSHCGYPHLDLGSFAVKPHRKHFCGNCGRDSTWSKEEIVSTPLMPLHDHFAATLKYEVPDRSINLDQLQDCKFAIWASTPAVVWTAHRPQELGIHVHVHDGKSRIIDDTFGEVILKGKKLDRVELVKLMADRTNH